MIADIIDKYLEIKKETYALQEEINIEHDKIEQAISNEIKNVRRIKHIERDKRELAIIKVLQKSTETPELYDRISLEIERAILGL